MIIIGRDRGYESHLRKEVKLLNLEEYVVFTGYRSDALQFLKSFDIFVLPSLTEGMPVALLEAMALARPVVATDTGGISEVLKNQRNGLVIPKASSESIVDAISYFIEKPQTAKALGTAAQKHIETQFSLSRMYDDYIKIYDHILGE